MQTHDDEPVAERIARLRSRIPAPKPGPSRIDQVLAAVSLVMGASLAATAGLALP
ncbi:hypothetical protein [Roseomonas sp. CECT 9278]|uniref:hypothetical protein n=1 Tax=Roseomonas sp. CECT 9278 TaxID=2845823 RepID=UPI001E3BEE1E|nr:hypothetical protein [Roseomonas sp. CECT 9278]CAH0236038.1 hypothetical protein ROS9278_02773 [Roseomonas sp. CECT 9278]